MLSFLISAEFYQREQCRQQLSLILPDAPAVLDALSAIDICELATGMPFVDIAAPYRKIIIAGKVLQAPQLLSLIEWAKRLNLCFAEFVDVHVLPLMLQAGPVLLQQLQVILFAAA